MLRLNSPALFVCGYKITTAILKCMLGRLTFILFPAYGQYFLLQRNVEPDVFVQF